MIDLHLHSSASDGDHSPEVLAGLCAHAGLGSVALTDHNTMRNVPAAATAFAERGIELIPGCEISTRWYGEEHHLLALWADDRDTTFTARIERVRQADLTRSRAWVEHAEAAGHGIDWGSVETLVGADRVPPFAVIARLLLEGGDSRMQPYRERRGHLWNDLFAPGRPLGTDAPYQPDLPDAIRWVHENGAVPVLAHPGRTLGRLDAEWAFRTLRGAGLVGVEAWTPHHTREEGGRFHALARTTGLLVTAGADFHGPTVKPWVLQPGQVSNNTEELLDALRSVAVHN